MWPTLLAVLRLASGVELTWEAPSQCPSQAEVSAQVDHFLQGSPNAANDVRAHVEVTSVGDAWVATLELSVGTDSEVRELRDPACDLVATATAFVVAVAVDPELPLREPIEPVEEPIEPVEEPIEPVEDPVEQPVEPIEPVEPAPPPSAARIVRGTVHVAAALDVGSLAQPTVGPRVTAGLAIGPWRLQIPAAVLPSARATAGSGSVQTTLWLAGVRGCRAFAWDAAEVPVCLGVEAGRFVARGRGYEDAATARAPWIAPTLDAALTWFVRDRWGLHVGAGAAVPASRPRFDVDGLGLAHRASVVAFRSELGFVARFP